jgi:hypothetical protein
MMHIDLGTSGQWSAMTAPGAILVVRSETGGLDALASAVRAEDPARRVIESLAAKGLSATPAFAFVATEGAATRVIVRGDVQVVLIAGGTRLVVDGGSVTTWAERVVADAEVLEITTGSERAEASTADVPAVNATVGGPARAAQRDPESDIPESDITEATVVDFDDDEPDAAAASPSAPADAPADDPYDHFFGSTIVRPIEAAAVRDDVPDDADTAADGAAAAPESEDGAVEADTVAEDSGDHDGMTVLTGDLRSQLGEARAQRPAPAPTRSAEASEPRYALVLPDGTREPLTGTVVIGRAPRLAKVSGGRVPRPLTLGGDDQDISRNHVQIDLEGDTVVVTDLHSRNGTSMTLPGAAPVRLRAGEGATALAGAVIDLGSGIVITLEQAD